MPASPSKPCVEQPCDRPRAKSRTRCAHHHRLRLKQGGKPRSHRSHPEEATSAAPPPLRIVGGASVGGRNIPSDDQIIAFHARIAAGLGSEHDNEIAVAAERSARLVLQWRDAHRGAGDGAAGRSVIAEALADRGRDGVDEIDAMVDAADQQPAEAEGEAG